MSPEFEIQEFRSRGIKFPTGHALTQEWTTGSGEGGFSFNEMMFAFDGAFRKPTITQVRPGKTWTPNTVYRVGDYVRPTVLNGNVYRVTVGGNSGAAEPDSDAAVAGAQWPIAPGSTITTNGVTYQQAGSDAIAGERRFYDINDVGADDIQTYEVQQGDRRENRARRSTYVHVPTLNISSERAGEMEVNFDLMGRLLEPVTLTTANIVELPTVYATPAMVQVYMDDTAAALGTTKVQSATIECELSDRFAQAWFHDLDQSSFIEHVETEASLEITVQIAESPQIDALVRALREGQRKFLRFYVRGPEIVPGLRYEFWWDISCQLSDSFSLSDEDGIYMAELTFAAERDPVWAKTTQLVLISALPPAGAAVVDVEPFDPDGAIEPRSEADGSHSREQKPTVASPAVLTGVAEEYVAGADEAARSLEGNSEEPPPYDEANHEAPGTGPDADLSGEEAPERAPDTEAQQQGYQAPSGETPPSDGPPAAPAQGPTPPADAPGPDPNGPTPPA